jgi:hypothetical protein
VRQAGVSAHTVKLSHERQLVPFHLFKAMLELFVSLLKRLHFLALAFSR